MVGKGQTDGNTVSIELPAGLFAALEKESKRKRKSVAGMLAALLEDQADYRAAEAVMKRVRAGTEKMIPAEEVYESLGLR